MYFYFVRLKTKLLFVLVDLPLILCSVAGVFLVHQTTNFAMDLFAIGSSCEPKLGVPLLLTVLFYNHVCSSAEKNNDFHDMLVSIIYPPEFQLPGLVYCIHLFEQCCQESITKSCCFFSMQLKLLALLPLVASHSAMIPLLHQVLLPMLHKDVNPYVICNCSCICFHCIQHMIYLEYEATT